MRTIDIHAHMFPRALWNAVDAKKDWYGYCHAPGPGMGFVEARGKKTTLPTPKMRYTPEERIKDMDAQGTDVQVLSIHVPFAGYDLPADQGRALAREVNDEIAGTVREFPKRFSGLATLPMQDVTSAIDELERAVTRLGLKGAELDTNVNGEQWDEAKYRPFFKAAEQMGAVLFYHPQPQNNFLRDRVPRYRLFNSLGVILDDAIVAAVLICGGVLQDCPDLKVCIAHGGGPLCYAMGRMDREWERTPPDQRSTPKKPSEYQRQLYYDTVTGNEEALRFLLDRVGADRVVLGSDWPFVHFEPGPAGWVQAMKSVSQEEKEKILSKNLETLLGL
ncbi:MAG TPA: amidohydrolase family protein [Burkholderiales bacterium]|nr:amidohydrolase family protein [Burkholderiales bacterium]